MVITFREPQGIRKKFKKKKDVTLTVLEPVRLNENLKNNKEKVEDLKQRVYNNMKEFNRKKAKEC